MRTAVLRLLAASSLFILTAGCSGGGDGEPLAARDDELVSPLRLCGGRFSTNCGNASYCRTAAGTCPGPTQVGICTARPQVCSDIYLPVCGCDGVTYPNACYANRAGATVASNGACPGVFCGGIANFPCPGLGKCVDDPSDDCDPTNGGADCSGVCQCIENVLCIRGTHFDNNPKVCTCVPDTGGGTCGSATCAAGNVCCNASCGICTPPGGVCIQIVCDPTI